MHGGLENLHHMTKEKRFELRVDMEDFEGNKVYSHYSSFYVGSESDGYVLEVSDFRDGGAGELQHTAVIHWGQSVTLYRTAFMCVQTEKHFRTVGGHLQCLWGLAVC